MKPSEGVSKPVACSCPSCQPWQVFKMFADISPHFHHLFFLPSIKSFQVVSRAVNRESPSPPRLNGSRWTSCRRGRKPKYLHQNLHYNLDHLHHRHCYSALHCQKMDHQDNRLGRLDHPIGTCITNHFIQGLTNATKLTLPSSGTS